MQTRLAHSTALVTVRFSSVLFTSLPDDFEARWIAKYKQPYPTEDQLRNAAHLLSRYAEHEAPRFVRFAEYALGVRGNEPIYVFYFCPWLGGSISEPGLINPTRAPHLMHLTLLHELLHRLLTRNDTYDIDQAVRGSLARLWRASWGTDLSLTTIAHIPVFALLESYVASRDDDLGLRTQLLADRQRHARFPDYAEAWAIVDKLGSRRVCETTKECYRQLRDKRFAA